MKPDVEIPSSLCRAQLTEYPPTPLFTPASKVTKCREEMLNEIVFPMDCGQDKLPVVQVLIWLSIVAFKSKLHQFIGTIVPLHRPFQMLTQGGEKKVDFPMGVPAD